MSPELETLDQLLGGDMSLEVVRRLFPDSDHFRHSVSAMVRAGDLRLRDRTGRIFCDHQLDGLLTNPVNKGVFVALTDAGAKRIT